MHPEVRRRIGQPACTGAFPLYRIGAEEAVHFVCDAVHLDAGMRRVV